MKNSTGNRLLALGSAIALAAVALSFAETVKLESKDGRRKEKEIGRNANPRLVRQISDTPCIKGRNWGYDGRRLWVDDGCRAEFRYEKNGSGSSGIGNVAGNVIKLESKDGRRAERRIGRNADVDLVRRLSDKPCEKGRGWGYSGDTLWVDRGCRAEFRVRKGAGWRPDIDSWDDRPTQKSDYRYRTLEVSSPGGRVFQMVGKVRRVELLETLSGNCIKGRSWDYDGARIWVDQGCKAKFRITEQ